MREIKFRAFDSKGIAGKVSIGKMELFDDMLAFRFAHFEQDVEDIIFEQFTGLHDKNGKEIYEGDIVRRLETDWISKSDNDPRTLEQYLKNIADIGKIEFDNGEFFVNVKGYHCSIIVGEHGFLEIIGNIHENSELLKCS